MISDTADVVYSVNCPLNRCFIAGSERRSVVTAVWPPSSTKLPVKAIHPLSGAVVGAGKLDFDSSPANPVRVLKYCQKCFRDFNQSPEVVEGLSLNFSPQLGCDCASVVCSDCWKRAVEPPGHAGTSVVFCVCFLHSGFLIPVIFVPSQTSLILIVVSVVLGLDASFLRVFAFDCALPFPLTWRPRLYMNLVIVPLLVMQFLDTRREGVIDVTAPATSQQMIT
jgi:hypothetical protein